MRQPSDWQVEAVGRLAVTAPAGGSMAQLWSRVLSRLTRCEIRREARKSSAMRATANNRRAIRLRTLVSRIATDLLAPHLAGARQPSERQVEAAGRLAVNATAGGIGVQITEHRVSKWLH
ncbi:MAG: hypothetical protein PHO37_18525 [Kiritimatiellae bacterium]|nr:hypothetical protein [Kiritimatiellia bacterium]